MSDCGTIICGFGESGTEFSDGEVEEEWGADYKLKSPPLTLSQIQGETAVDLRENRNDNMNHLLLNDSVFTKQQGPIESKLSDPKDFSAVQKMAIPPNFSTLSIGMEKENGSRDQYCKEDFQLSFNKSITLCDLVVINKDENVEEDSQYSRTNRSICLCDLKVIDEDENTVSECLPIPSPPLSNSMRVSKIQKDFLQANERRSQRVPKLLSPAPHCPIILE